MEGYILEAWMVAAIARATMNTVNIALRRGEMDAIKVTGPRGQGEWRIDVKDGRRWAHRYQWHAWRCTPLVARQSSAARTRRWRERKAAAS